MKISYMQKRENFFDINEKTLKKYYGDDKEEKKLYIYSELNTITTSKPSKKVKEYIYTEFSVRGNIIRKIAAYAYSRLLLNSFGIFATKKIKIGADADKNTLIYPCNKKYRIFDFGKDEVSVIVKDGFNNNDLTNEISFRQKADVPDFVPRILRADGNGYTEKVIDGKPLARIEKNFEALKEKAYKLFFEYAKSSIKTVSGAEYAKSLNEKIEGLTTKKVRNKEKLEHIKAYLIKLVEEQKETEICFSHGDLQAGNIWIENGTGKIYIIDWESWGERSVWYDKAVLFDGLRPYGAAQYIRRDIPEAEKATVLLEDIIFNLNDLNNLPSDFGEEQFEAYINGLYEQIKEKEVSE